MSTQQSQTDIRVPTWPRIVCCFLVAPLVVPLTFFIYDVAFEGSSFEVTEFVGTLLNYGAFAYFFALLLGVPIFIALMRGRLMRIGYFAAATGCIALIAALIFSRYGLRPGGVVVGVISGVLAGAVFYYLGGFSRVANSPAV